MCQWLKRTLQEQCGVPTMHFRAWLSASSPPGSEKIPELEEGAGPLEVVPAVVLEVALQVHPMAQLRRTSLVVGSVKVTMGAAYAFGSDPRSISVIAVPPGGPPAPAQTNLDVKFSRFNMLVGFDFGR